jgi:hypothetical protein
MNRRSIYNMSYYAWATHLRREVFYGFSLHSAALKTN